MEWIKEPKGIINETPKPRDACTLRICGVVAGDLPCGVKLCVTRYCIINY